MIFLSLLLPSLSFASVFGDLSEKEITETVTTLKSDSRFKDQVEDLRFPSLSLSMPDKEKVLKCLKTNCPRQTLLTVYNGKKNELFEVIITPELKKIESVKQIKGVQPMILMEEYSRLNDIVRKDPTWIAAIKKRGFDNPDDIYIDGWAPGLLSDKERKSGKRYMRGPSYYKGKNSNYYARPIEGLLVTVDMNENKVVEVLDLEKRTLAVGAQDYSPVSAPSSFSSTTEPQFKVGEDQEVQWGLWKFHFHFDGQKGLTLYHVRLKDQTSPEKNGPGEKELSYAYKMGLSEMVVPYGDSAVTWAFRNAFDVGEYGVAKTAHTLVRGVDVPAAAQLFPIVTIDDRGELLKIEDGVAIYERPAGVLWKHMDGNDRKSVAQTASELVVTFMTTVGNYDYGISYIFQQDGTLQVEAALTGILLAKGSDITKNFCTGGCIPLVEKNIIAPPHQHFFSFRLDLDVASRNNSAYEMNVMALKKNNPYHNAFEMVNTPLLEEKKANGSLNLASQRKWKLVDDDNLNDLSHPRGIELYAGENSLPFLSKKSLIRKKATFLEHHVWVTRYHEEEQSSAGNYPNQNFKGEGLSRFIQNNESLEKEDLVLWYTMGITHIPRPEEWPIMNAHRASFKLMPINFFSHNPMVQIKK